MNYSLWKSLACLISAISLLVLITAGCNRKSELVGTWSNDKVPEIVEFRADGNGMFSYQGNSNPPLRFTWKESGKGKYLLNVDYMGTGRVLVAALQDKTLIVEGDAGKEFYSKREIR